MVRAREAVLRNDLFELRKLISQYTLDKQKAPQSLDNLVAAIGAPGAGFCSACLTGNYPAPVPVTLGTTSERPRHAAPAPA